VIGFVELELIFAHIRMKLRVVDDVIYGFAEGSSYKNCLFFSSAWVSFKSKLILRIWIQDRAGNNVPIGQKLRRNLGALIGTILRTIADLLVY